MYENLQMAYTWASENWLIIALVVSEIAALLPTKANGILQGVIKFGNAIFKKRGGKIK